jgi:hypothetical protein
MTISTHPAICYVSRIFHAEGQRERRIAVVGTVAAIAATLLTSWLIGTLDLSLWFLAAPIATATLAHVAGYRICFNDADAWKVANGSESSLDERQIRVRNLAYTQAYRIVAGVFALGVIYTGTAYLQGYWLPTGWGQITSIIWIVLLGTILLPAAFIAWTEPDFPDDFEI